HGIGEFGRLAEELNRLGEQVRRERESGSAPIAGIDESRTIAELGRMAAGAAHQLGNRLQGVHMDLRSLQHAERLSSEEVRDRAKEAVSALESLDRVVRGFLKMARIRPLAPEMVPLDDLLREVHRQLRQEAALAGIEIVIGPSSPEAVAFVDPEVVRQAMTNVIRNSIQAIGDRGGRIALAAAAEGDEVRLSIADDGPGMPPEVVERAFELYFTTRGDGHGIGLPLVRQAVERHGGRALLRSDVGKGTEVTLVFPRPGAPRRRAAPDVTSSR
ncbi:MAG: sensor histidine kinase, partial [Candidatus Latescibacterota bacterium]